MTTVARPHVELPFFHPGVMHSPAEDIFTTPSLKRCQPSAHDRKSDHYVSNESVKRMRYSESDLPEELISLSYNLLNQIQRHEQQESRADSVTSDISSREDPPDSATRSMSADSSSSSHYNGFNTDVLSEMTEDTTSLSPLSMDSPSEYREYSPCDSAGGPCTTSGSKKSTQQLVTKPLYTAELQVLCRICGDRASGFHYGVHSCEGCKGFFRRTLKKDLVYKPCRENSQCRIDTGTRNKCQYCRYQKCLNAGMSQNAVRFGRMPKVEREKLIADKEELSTTCSTRIMELRTLSDSMKGAFQDSFTRCKFVNYLQSGDSVKIPFVKIEPDLGLMADCIDKDTFIERDIFKVFQDAVVPVIEGMVKFTKRIPSFSKLAMQDRIILLKQNCFSATLILTYLLFDDCTLYLLGQNSSLSVTDCQGHFQCVEAQKLFSGIFRIGQRLLDMHLKKVEVALYSAAVLVIESTELSSAHEVEQLQSELLDALRLELKHNHPKDRFLFPRLLVLIADLIEVTEEFRSSLKCHVFDKSGTFAKTHELFCEIFDLR